MEMANEREKLDPEEAKAVAALVERSGIAYGTVTVCIHVKQRRPDRIEITSRRDVIGKISF